MVQQFSLATRRLLAAHKYIISYGSQMADCRNLGNQPPSC